MRSLITTARRIHRSVILNSLQKLSLRSDVFVKRIDDEGNLPDYDRAYVFANEKETLLVVLDHYPCHTEVVEEKGENEEEAKVLHDLFSSNERPNPIYVIKKMAESMRQRCSDEETVWSLLLTDSSFFGLFSMEGKWDIQSLTIRDNVRGVSEVDFYEENGGSEATRQRVRNMFCKADKKAVEDKSGNADAPNVYADFINTDGWADNVEADVDFPDGVIKQNERTNIKLEILKPMPKPWEELDRMVGCRDIKKHFDELLSLARYNKMLQVQVPGSKSHEVSLHSLFLGGPGTGKTTVCKIFGSLLRNAGALSKGHVVVCNRATFMGSLWGDEERIVRGVLDAAQGGVLMIDEAYLMMGVHREDPSKIAVQMLMETLSNERKRDIAVVLCGYKEQIRQLLSLNPGLLSRFPNQFEFPDFTLSELLEITRRRIAEYGYRFTRAAWLKYRQTLADAYQDRDPHTWGNARFVANLLERIYVAHAQRCVAHSQTQDPNRLLVITSADIPEVAITRQKPRIGF